MVSFFSSLWPQLCGGRSQGLWSHCFYKAICLKSQSQRQFKTFPSFVPRHQAYGTWSLGMFVCVHACVCVTTHPGWWGGRLVLSWSPDSSILEYLGVHGLLLGCFSPPCFSNENKIFKILWLHPWHVEISRPEIESEPQL